jgi:hypothetical protein
MTKRRLTETEEERQIRLKQNKKELERERKKEWKGRSKLDRRKAKLQILYIENIRRTGR